MGDVILVIRVLPKDPESFEKVKSALETLDPKRLEDEPIAFGLKALKVTFMVPDEGGHQDKLENKIKSIEGVGEFEVIQASRSL